MAGVTGNPAKLLVIDDPVRTREEAFSTVTREKVWQEWLSSIKSRLANGAKVIMIMTRWHEDDLAGRILKSERNVLHINLTAEAEIGDVLGRKPGEGLFPEIGKGTEWVQQMKRSYIAGEGTEAWNSMYQGRPSMQSGNIFKKDWFKFYDVLPQVYSTIISVDAAFKDKASSDFVAIGVWGKSGSSVFLIDVVNERLDFVRTVETIRALKQKYPEANMILIEDKANGSAIISTLQREIMGIVPVEPLGSKEARAYSIQPFILAGNVFLPSHASWKEEYIDQMTRFPKGRYDDMVDMTSQALSRLKDFVASGPPPPVVKPHFTALRKGRTVTSELTGGQISKSYLGY
jgi:predicted phage terminase large subunit-like protein